MKGKAKKVGAENEVPLPVANNIPDCVSDEGFRG